MAFRTYVFALLLAVASAFAPSPSNHPLGCISERSEVKLGAFAGLARKMKMKEIAGLREANEELLRLRGTKTATDEISSVLKKRSGTVSVIAEYRRKSANRGAIDDILPPYIVSRDFRAGGAEVMSVLLDKATGGCTPEDFTAVVEEQDTAKSSYPGPLPLIWHDMVVDEIQLAQAAGFGAKGILLSVGVLADELQSMVTAAAEYGLESILEVKSVEEVEAAKKTGASMVAIGGMSVDDGVALMADVPDDMIKIFFLPVYDDKQLIEAEDSWRLRDAGCNCIWASEVLFKFGFGDGEHTLTVLKAIKSKGSVKYARASGAFTGKGEGAKEFLGTIEM